MSDSFGDAPLPQRSQTPDPRDPGYERLLALLQLAERGSRELDAAIADVMGAQTIFRRGEWEWLFHGAWRSLPPYTTSLDAALTLCASGTLWAVGSMEDGPFARLCWPQKDGGYIGGYHEGRGATAPLALVIAALKARHAEPPK